jgi:uncharacterized membrane protein
MNKTNAVIVAIIIILVIGVGSFMFIAANSHNTKVDVISNSTLKNGDFVQIQLKDEYRNVYPNEKVSVKILDDSGWGNTYQLTTDENGEAAFALDAYENGNYTIHCNYDGSLFNKPDHSIYSLTIDDGYYDEYYYY